MFKFEGAKSRPANKSKKQTHPPQPLQQVQNLHELRQLDVEETQVKQEAVDSEELLKSPPTLSMSSRRTTTDEPTVKINRQEIKNFTTPARIRAIEDDSGIMIKTSPTHEQTIQTQPKKLNHNDIKKPNLRKKLCMKVAKYLEETYNLKQEVAREKAVTIEQRIRGSSPNMELEYRERAILITKILRVTPPIPATVLIILQAGLTTIDELTDNEYIDWDYLRKHSMSV